MPTPVFLGEFEQLVLLGVLHLAPAGYALPLRQKLEELAGRRVSRGALYRTLDRLERKGYVEWQAEDGTPERGGHPRRRFLVTPSGISVLRASRETLIQLWDGVEEVLS